jgi:hypothetical protein
VIVHPENRSSAMVSAGYSLKYGSRSPAIYAAFPSSLAGRSERLGVLR